MNFLTHNPLGPASALQLVGYPPWLCWKGTVISPSSPYEMNLAELEGVCKGAVLSTVLKGYEEIFRQANGTRHLVWFLCPACFPWL